MKIFNLDLLVAIEANPSKLYQICESDNERKRLEGHGYLIIDGNAYNKPNVCLRFAGNVLHQVTLDSYEKCVEYANTFHITNKLVIGEQCI